MMTDMVSILLIDDEPRIARALAFALRNSDMQVTSLADTDQLDATIEAGSPDVILLDIGLAATDGLTICSRLKQDPRFSDIPVILLSRQTGAETKAAGFEAGADDFIPKPFVPTELV